MIERGLVHVYTGNGKGKTTAAFGLALRSWGRGNRVRVLQFMKLGDEYGEAQAFRRIGIRIDQFGRGAFVFEDKVREEDREAARAGLRVAAEALGSGDWDMVVMDEVCVAVYFGLLDVEDVVSAVEARADGVEAVLTGRKAPDRIKDIADYVTEMRLLKHPYDQGISARQGVEY